MTTTTAHRGSSVNTFKEHVDAWAIMTRPDGTHYATWAENSTFETAATIDKGALVVQQKHAKRTTSVPIPVIQRLIELEGSP